MAATPITVYETIAQSNIPRKDKSAIMNWVDNMAEGFGARYLDNRGNGPEHVTTAVDVIRGDGEGLVIGGALGALHAQFGLDIKRVPADLALSILTGLLSVGRSGKESSADLRNVSVSAISVFAFRKTDALLSELKKATGSVPRGNFVSGESSHVEEDPVVAAAANL